MSHALAKMHYSPLEYEDAFQWGCVGLVVAAQAYDDREGVAFATYAYWRIRGAVQDALRHEDIAPRSVRDAINGKPALPSVTSKVIAFYRDLHRTSLDQLMEFDGRRSSFDISDPNVREPTLGDEFDWDALMAVLTSRERDIITSIFFEDVTQTAVAHRLSISVERCGQIKRRALQKLQREVEAQRAA